MNTAELDRLFNPKNTEMSIFACIETGMFKMIYELWSRYWSLEHLITYFCLRSFCHWLSTVFQIHCLLNILEYWSSFFVFDIYRKWVSYIFKYVIFLTRTVYWSKIILWDVTESLKKLESKNNQSRSDQYKSAFYWATEEQQISYVSFSISVNDLC